ncbi:uncharacterized protein [Panulirus ornatus]|uniref:uncharacterized protein isoform X2 n=1 Tax=Panulirus ornatus TaxID=150431 RepID=UPI003A850068
MTQVREEEEEEEEGGGGDRIQQGISLKISPVRRLCRVDASEEEAAVETECVAACPLVLRHLCTPLTPSARSNRSGRESKPSLDTLQSCIKGRPYWHRCLCSPVQMPFITERELLPLLSLTPAHRFIILVVTNSAQSLGSVVVGGESLMEALYISQNQLGLRPCLQSPSEPSLAFIKYEMAKAKVKRRERKGTLPTILNGGRIQIGMIYQKTQMLYSGFPLTSYGCMKQDFLKFISKYTKYDFHHKTPVPHKPMLQPPDQVDVDT